MNAAPPSAANRDADDLADAGPPDAPTSAVPGSPQKVAVLAERARRRQQLWHPLDYAGHVHVVLPGDAAKALATPQAEAVLRRAAAEGWTVRRAAEALGVAHHGAVAKRLRRLGGASAEGVRRQRSAAALASPRGQELLRQALCGECTKNAAARALGVDAAAVAYHVRKMLARRAG